MAPPRGEDWSTSASGLIEDIGAEFEAAAFNPAGFTQVLETSAHRLNVNMIYLLALETERLEMVGSAEAQDFAEAYRRGEWWLQDLPTPRMNRVADLGRMVRETDVLSAEELRRSTIFHEFNTHYGVDAIVGWKAPITEADWGFALTRRHNQGGAFTDREMLVLGRLTAPVNRAITLLRHFRNARVIGAAQGMDASGFPCVLLDQTGLVCFVSSAAHALFDTDFQIREGRLWSSDPTATAQLDQVAAKARAPLGDRSVLLDVRVRRAFGRAPIGVRPVRLSGDGLDALPGGRLLLILDSGSVAPLPADPSILTPRERECLQCLAWGLRVEAVARRLEIAVVTVELHIRNARRKLGAQTTVQAIAAALSSGQIRY